MKTTTTPAARFGWQGQTLEYVVRADGASEIAVPKERSEGLDIRVTDVRQVGDGVEAQVIVDVSDPVFYCDSLHLEARSASGAVQQIPVGLMTVPECMLGGFAVVGALALVGAVFAIRWGGWAGWILGILAALVAIVGLGFGGFGMWGRFAGYPFGIGG